MAALRSHLDTPDIPYQELDTFKVSSKLLCDSVTIVIHGPGLGLQILVNFHFCCPPTAKSRKIEVEPWDISGQTFSGLALGHVLMVKKFFFGSS